MGDLAVAAVGDVAGVNSVAGCLCGSRGRNASNHAAERVRIGKTRLISSASIRAGDRKSSPPGSHAWQPRSSPNQRTRRVGDQVGEAGIVRRRPVEREHQREGAC